MASFSMAGSVNLYPRFVDGPVAWTESISASLDLANGTGSGKANAYWSSVYTLNATDDVTFDLLALSYTAFGDSGVIGISSVKTFVVANTSTTTSLTLEPGASNGWDKIDGTVTIAPSGLVLMHFPSTGLAVTGSAKTVKVANTDTVTTLTGNTTNGSANVTALSSTSGLSAGMLVDGTGIPTNTKILGITNSTSLVLSANATATGTGVSLNFQWPAAVVKVYVAGILD